MKLRSAALALAVIAGVAAVASAEATFYDIGKNGENKVNISWESKASVETMVGRSTKADGLVILDPQNAEKSWLKISVPVDSIKTGIDMRDEHMRGDQWLDAKKFPTIDFESTKIAALDHPNAYRLTGNLTIHGVTKEYTIEGTATPVKALGPEMEKYGYKGDMVHLEATWEVKLADHGIKIPQGMGGLKVAESVKITIDVFGLTNGNPKRDDPRAKKG